MTGESIAIFREMTARNAGLRSDMKRDALTISVDEFANKYAGMLGAWLSAGRFFCDPSECEQIARDIFNHLRF